MTSQQLTLVLMAGAGVGLFVAGRIAARKLVPEKKPSFMPSSELLSYGGTALTAPC